MKSAFRDLQIAVEEKRDLSFSFKYSPAPEASPSLFAPRNNAAAAATTATTPEQTDIYLQQQAAVYERNLALKNIQRTIAVKQQTEIKPDLAPLDEFKAASSKYLENGTSIKDLSEHQLLIKRMEHELDQRKECGELVVFCLEFSKQ